MEPEIIHINKGYYLKGNGYTKKILLICCGNFVGKNNTKHADRIIELSREIILWIGWIAIDLDTHSYPTLNFFMNDY